MRTQARGGSGRLWLLLLGLALLCAVIAVGCPAAHRAGRRATATPAPTVPVSLEAARRFEQKTGQLDAGGFSLELTDQEVTSYIALNLADQLPIATPQVRFLPGSFVLEGDLLRPVHGRIQLTGNITVEGGQARLEFQSATLGEVGLPRALLASLSDSLLEAAGLDSSQVAFTAITLEAGRVVASGRLRGP